MRKDWIEIEIPEIISEEGLFSDGDWVESKDQDPYGEVRLIQLADIGDGEFLDKSNRRLSYSKSIELNCTYLQKGDLLLARMPKPLGRASIFPLIGEKKYVTVVDVAIIRTADKNIEGKYLLYVINSPNSRKKIEALQSGTTRKRISKKNLSKIKFPLPPLPEQKAIVAKIEQLFSDLDNGIANLKKAQDQLKIYRQAVLKKAFEGKLTKDFKLWRKQTLRDIFKINSGNGLTKANRDDNGDYLVYGGNGITGKHSEFMFEEPKLIIGRVGAHCGNTHITKSKSWVTDNAFVVTFDEQNNIMLFFYYLIKYLNLNQYAGSTAQPVISGTKVYPVTCNIPNKAIQENVVQEIESRLSVCDNVEANIKEALKKSESLRQSILKKAFEGKLLTNAELEEVRNDPEWEPAEKLLERIQAEKAKQKKQKQRKNK